MLADVIISRFPINDLELLLQAGTNPNSVVVHGLRPLHYAAFAGGDQRYIDKLVEYGALVNCIDNVGYTPLHVAAKAGHRDALRCLLQHGADVNGSVTTVIETVETATIALPSVRDTGGLDPRAEGPIHAQEDHRGEDSVEGPIHQDHGGDDPTEGPIRAHQDHEEEDRLDTATGETNTQPGNMQEEATGATVHRSLLEHSHEDGVDNIVQPWVLHRDEDVFNTTEYAQPPNSGLEEVHEFDTLTGQQSLGEVGDSDISIVVASTGHQGDRVECLFYTFGASDPTSHENGLQVEGGFDTFLVVTSHSQQCHGAEVGFDTSMAIVANTEQGHETEGGLNTYMVITPTSQQCNEAEGGFDTSVIIVPTSHDQETNNEIVTHNATRQRVTFVVGDAQTTDNSVRVETSTLEGAQSQIQTDPSDVTDTVPALALVDVTNNTNTPGELEAEATLPGDAESPLTALHKELELTSSLTDSPLNIAVEYGHVECVEELLVNHADPNITSFLGSIINTMPLEHIKCLKLLLRHGADPDALSRGGMTALMRAAKQQQVI